MILDLSKTASCKMQQESDENRRQAMKSGLLRYGVCHGGLYKPRKPPRQSDSGLRPAEQAP